MTRSRYFLVGALLLICILIFAYAIPLKANYWDVCILPGIFLLWSAAGYLIGTVHLRGPDWFWRMTQQNYQKWGKQSDRAEWDNMRRIQGWVGIVIGVIMLNSVVIMNGVHHQP